jgi:hypothetical protein
MIEIRLKIGGRKITLTSEQAQELHRELDAMYGRPQYVPYPYYPSPVIVNPTPYPWYTTTTATDFTNLPASTGTVEIQTEPVDSHLFHEVN